MKKKRGIKRGVKKSLFKSHNKENKTKCGNTGGWIYFLGIIGSAIYYIQNATSFWYGVLGILKALIWPAFLVYELLKFLMS